MLLWQVQEAEAVKRFEAWEYSTEREVDDRGEGNPKSPKSLFSGVHCDSLAQSVSTQYPLW